MAKIDWRTRSFEEAKTWMRTGDVIAFGGHSWLSDLIKVFTRSEVSHAGAIVLDEQEMGEPELVESTAIFDQEPPLYGVHRRRFAEALNEYDGEVWWLPLDDRIRDDREAFDNEAFLGALANAEGEPFDLSQAFMAVAWDSLLDMLGLIGRGAPEDLEDFFCSELVAMALESAGAVGSVNASSVTPIDLCRWSIYQQDHYLLKGNDLAISGHNKLTPGVVNPPA